jgi:hypothetical protein
MERRRLIGTFKIVLLLILGALVGFQPVLTYRLPRSSESWSHLQNLDRIPGPLAASDVPRMLELFENRQHYTKYPLFYVICEALSVDSALKAAVFSAAVFSILPVLVFLVASTRLDQLSAMTAGIITAVAPSFVYTTNFFSGGEPLAIALMLAGLYLYLRHRPLAALPAFGLVILLHPITSLFLWVLILVMLVLGVGGNIGLREDAICTSIYSALLLLWLLFQISTGLPLGEYMVSNISSPILVLSFVVVTLAALLARWVRVGSGVFSAGSLRHPLDRLVGLLTGRLTRVILVLEVSLIVLFVACGVPGTQNSLNPSHLVYYSPLLVLIALPALAGPRPRSEVTSAMIFSFLGLLAVGLTLFSKGVPVYRLAPYGTLSLALLVAPVVRYPRLRWVLPLLLLGLAATAYPEPALYFGFDEQYYPAEDAAVSRCTELTLSGSVHTDVRMEDMIAYRTDREVIVTGAGGSSVGDADLVLITENMREQGFYPPGAEWHRTPFRVELGSLHELGNVIYDNGWSELYWAAGREIPLEAKE